MQARCDRDAALHGDWKVVAGKAQLFESVSPLELRYRAIRLLSVDMLSVNEVEHPLRHGSFDRLRQKRIRRALIEMGIEGKDLHDPGDFPHVDDFDETDQLLFKKGAEELAAITVSGVIAANGL